MILYWAAYDGEGGIDGLYRLLVDDESQTASFERHTATGWVDDPSAITETREPGVEPVDGATAAELMQQIVDAADSVANLDQEDAVQGGAQEDVPTSRADG